MTGNSLNNTKVRSNISTISRYDVHTIIAEIIAKDSRYFLFSMLESFHGCNFNKVTNTQQLSQDCS